MLTHIKVKNFKRFGAVAFELGANVVLIGPNNSGKTTALQALALWNIGLARWLEKRGGQSAKKKRQGVVINRQDLIAIPSPDAKLLWRNLHVHSLERKGNSQNTQNVRIEITVSGITGNRAWDCGLEFDYANSESLYCRPLRMEEGKDPMRMEVPEHMENIKLAFLPPMSGLAAVEPKWEPGRINVLIGEGQTAQVLRNLCYRIYEESTIERAAGADNETRTPWVGLQTDIRRLFGVEIQAPGYMESRGEVTMSYREGDGPELDISSTGRGLQQTLLLLAHLYTNPNSILLLDEPDAHMEVLRQRQIYQLLTDVAKDNGSQIIAASHSEVILNEAADRDIVVAFVKKPHRMDARSRVTKALVEMRYDQYYQAEQKGWVLYLEGSSDLAILKSFAKTLDHPVAGALEQAFVHYVSTNLPHKAREHFSALREAKPDLRGVALFDRLDKQLPKDPDLMLITWHQREIENYLCREEVLFAYAQLGLNQGPQSDLFVGAELEKRNQAMRAAIDEVSKALETLGKKPWSADIKASDEFLEHLFQNYFKKLALPNQMTKSNYHVLAHLLPVSRFDPEITEKLDVITQVATDAAASLPESIS
uniref:Predicted ATPase n=1 Tax=Candidatus Kentrum sp. TUN TaxID=2126343 RepID=A0A450ZL77_9GAMM|nr:MAG: Predicted ATPase [Candidatus Kentron sp. TUN]VFK54575.1 MAG: Predicted ATPase [Candidatus Kentron sp. TUN]VFK57595.1 MAG: Predicted ATPase [Candidatus Kentron sp. TUN]